MDFYEMIFIILFIWSSIFTVSMAANNFKGKDYLSAINAVILQITATLLCITYLIEWP